MIPDPLKKNSGLQNTAFHLLFSSGQKDLRGGGQVLHEGRHLRPQDEAEKAVEKGAGEDAEATGAHVRLGAGQDEGRARQARQGHRHQEPVRPARV